MGFPTKVQLIKRKASEQWYINSMAWATADGKLMLPLFAGFAFDELNFGGETHGVVSFRYI